MPRNNESFEEIKCDHCQHIATAIPGNSICFKKKVFCSWQCKCQYIRQKYKNLVSKVKVVYELIDPFVSDDESSDEEVNAEPGADNQSD